MFDALQDTPRDFQFKLMDALNSLGQTMEIPPTECFDKVLCASDDENPDVKKKMYNWWRAFFEVLGRVSDGKMPKVRVSEYNEKIDALMAEIMKSGDKEASGDNEVVLEDGYEEAPKADEDDMLKDFDFAVQHIGEIANKVKDIVNFINPYCETKEVHDTMKKTTNERGGSDWVSMNDIVGMEVGESDNGEAFWKAVDDVDDLERKGYWSGKFKVGDKVTWIEPNKGYPSDGWTVEVVSPGKHPSGDDLYIISRGKSSVMNIRGSELRPAKMMQEVGESDWDGKSITRTLNFTNYEAEDLMDYIAEEIAHLEGEDSGLNIMGIVPKRVLEYIEMKGLASSVKRLNPREVVVKWAVGSNDEDEFAPAKGIAKSVYDLVKDIYDGNSEYSESKVELGGSEDEQKPDEVKDGEKKYKQDGETKTLVTGSDKENNNKKEVTEMTIEQEVVNPWTLVRLMWGQGRENLSELLESELFDEDFVMQMIEDMEIHNLTALNDAFAYDFETILDMFGCDVDAYRDNLEIKRAGDDSEEEEKEED